MHDELIKVLFSEDEIARRIAVLGGRINDDYRYRGRPLLIVGILRGSVIFCSDLLRHIERTDVAIDFMSVSSYGASHTTSGEVRLLKDLDDALEGKDIIIVEDIIDTGLTLSFLKRVLLSRHPASLKVCCLLDKPSRRKVEISADYVGFTIPNDFVVGYGLDYNQKYRNLKYIAVIDPDKVK